MRLALIIDAAAAAAPHTHHLQWWPPRIFRPSSLSALTQVVACTFFLLFSSFLPYLMSSQTHTHPIDFCFPLGCQGALGGEYLRGEGATVWRPSRGCGSCGQVGDGGVAWGWCWVSLGLAHQQRTCCFIFFPLVSSLSYISVDLFWIHSVKSLVFIL